MRAEWRFAGRRDELAAVRSVPPGRPILVRGPAGIGKTRLAREAVGRDQNQVWLAASNQLSGVRYGALAPLLTQLTVPLTGDESELLARLDRALAEHPAPPLVVVVDDVGRADAGTLGALALLANGARVRLVLTSRDTDPLPEFVNRLYDAGTLDVLELEPLDRSDVEHLLTAAFGASLDPDSLRAFIDRSGGNPLLLRELARGAIAAGPATAGPNGLAPVPVPSPRLAELIGERFAGLPATTRRLVELLALTGPLRGVEVTDQTTLEHAELDGLVTVGDDGSLQLGHPLFAEVLVSLLPRTRLRRIRREAATLLRGDERGDAQVRAALLTVDNGDRIALDHLHRAAAHALACGDHATVLRITDAAGAPAADDADVLRLRGHALSFVGDHDGAVAALEQAIAAAGDDERRARACRALAEHLAVRARRPAAAVRRIDAVMAGIAAAEWRRFLAADRTRWAILSGERLEHACAPDAHGLTTHVADDGVGGNQSVTGDEVARLNVTMTEALVAVMAGRLAAADRHIDAGLPLADRLRAEVPNGADLLRLTRWVLLLFAGQLEQSRAHAVAALEAAGPGSESAGTWEYAVALVELHAGRPAAAAARSGAAIPLLEWRDFTGLVDTTRAVHATALAQLGRAAEARTEIDRLAAPGELDVWAALQLAQAEAWLAVAERRRPDLAGVVAAGRRGVAAGQLCLGAFTGHTAVRLGAPELVVDDLHDAALRAEGAVIPAFAAHATAAAARRPTDLLDAGAQLAELGLAGAAADAARQAAALFAAAGRPDAARHAGRRASSWAGATGPAHDLTARELAIATRAADRWSSRAIAEQLGVSVRTVDNHLGRVYRKLGIAGRPELGQALRAVGAGG